MRCFLSLGSRCGGLPVVAVVVVVALVGFGATAGATARSSSVTVTDLGTLGGTSSQAVAVNNSGQVVGYSKIAGNETHAFSWTKKGGMVDLGTLGGTSSRAAAVNSGGQVVGYSITAAPRR